MRERLGSMRRLLRVYEAVEKMHEADASRAASEVREIEEAIAVESRRSRIASECEMQAMAAGDCFGRSVAVVQQKAGGWRRARLTGVLHEREERSFVARQRHMDSRGWSERVQRLADQATEDAEKVEAKREQMAADDRFLSRSRWMRLSLKDRVSE